MIATKATYHGNTSLVSQLSCSNVPAVGFALEQYFRFVAAPNWFRNPDPTGALFAQAVAEKISELAAAGLGFAALVVCPIFLNEGFPSHRYGWLKPAADIVRKAGGLLICDEVQSGFARTGTHMWAHEKMGIDPDSMTLGKPMANGHPVGGVFTNADIMSAFRSGYRYFDTVGGNPVSCAAGLAVLEELRDRALVSNANTVGQICAIEAGCAEAKYDVIGDIRVAALRSERSARDVKDQSSGQFSKTQATAQTQDQAWR